MLWLCPPGVYRAQSDTSFLAKVMEEGRYAEGRDVLDLGTGSGALALAAARLGAASVTAVDLSVRSVATTWLNARLRRAVVSVCRGDLYRPVRGRRFDLIVTNPPYVPAPRPTLPRFGIARCWDAGSDGRALLDRICAQVATHLTDDGVLLLVHSSVCGADQTLRQLTGVGLRASVVERTRIPFGPVMRARTTMLVNKGLIQPTDTLEELLVIEARR
jgi:release factor glutamine methyltransferase